MSSPSIVPYEFQFDRDVYLVMDDLGGQFGRIWRETSAQAADPQTISQTCWMVSTPIRSRSLPSIPRNSGRGIFLGMLRANCVAAAIRNTAICRRVCGISWTASNADITALRLGTIAGAEPLSGRTQFDCFEFLSARACPR
jgi:hypothetical protein